MPSVFVKINGKRRQGMYIYNKVSNISEEENISVKEYIARKEIYKPHMHEFIEFVYVKSGAAVHTVDNKRYNLSHGDMLIIDYGQVHSFEPKPEVDYVNILLNPEFLSSELTDIESVKQLLMYDLFEEFLGTEQGNKQCIHFGKKYREDVDHLINQMIREYSEKKLGYRSVLKGNMRILLSWILRETNFKEDSDVVGDVIEYINHNFSKKLDLQELAARNFYNPSYFSRLIKEKVGKSFSSYIREKRMQTAGNLLVSASGNVEEIMSMVGYKDKKIFYRHFKEFYGVSPGEYRRNHKKD